EKEPVKMKAILICPAERRAVPALSEFAPLANVPVLGRSLIEYWLGHLAALGAREVLVLASDRPEQGRALVENGARVGVDVEVFPEIRELAVREARKKYHDPDSTWLPMPQDITLMDHLPDSAEFPLFNSYAGWFAGVRQWLPRAQTPDRIGAREVSPG